MRIQSLTPVTMLSFLDRSTPGRSRARKRLVAAMVLILVEMLGVPGRSPAQTGAHLQDAWGVRLGVLAVPEYPGAHPLLQPFYESRTSDLGGLTAIVDLTLAFTTFAKIEFPNYNANDQLLDYGFHGGVRYTFTSLGTVTPFGTAGLGLDVYPDPIWPDTIGHVSASFPITFGALYDLSHTAQLEVALIARPQWYFRQGWSFAYALSVGGRFLTFSE
ncbi:MAG: hypothetical protein Q8922_04925 [Bacteroidota bacterium]|nr:hypothetical protein [Bacteroidota bacterium]